jgi:hypothetical protein
MSGLAIDGEALSKPMLGHGSNPAHGESDAQGRSEPKRRGFRPTVSIALKSKGETDLLFAIRYRQFQSSLGRD